MTQDLNKGIQSITYNYLNLPAQMEISHTGAQGKAYYTYSATGQKLQVIREHASLLREAPMTGLSTMATNQTETTD